MKTKKFFVLAAVLLFAATGFSSCSDDEQPKPNGNETPVEDPVDELAVLQQSLVKIDEEGNLVERILGVPLDAAVPDEVSVGVDSYDEALGIFHHLFADTTNISDDGTYAEFSIQKGSARLTKGSGEDELVAVADFDVEGLKHVSKISFILNSSWPENAGEKGFHKLGVQYEYNGMWPDEKQEKAYTFVCIREYQNGKPALLVGMTPNNWRLEWTFNVNDSRLNMPDRAKTEEIHKILKANWNLYVNAFTVNGTKMLKEDEQYWIRSGKYTFFANYLDAVNLKTGEIKTYEVGWHDHFKKVLLYIESGLKK